mmetsp:Transcript_19967/g.48895  ORF Transcript_19967/g.48895 Transcript_19967/m.48895 type:complete len:736 (-) Transcript_19967:321-2528(-)|eukprot:CAMPEP_0114499952 /NCGR_PEP_ID=MMETSP0109-20121206/7697_1 /TAXON_ID=29199 /ORGANISM="Chlorarachnion reptans, Strain CCCM449" /LENGTH=735 /DNA_ID=CAMNT_0001677565 /DNA_START=302 /DNA_END=2509 /DNA_ORIENTATION=-
MWSSTQFTDSSSSLPVESSGSKNFKKENGIVSSATNTSYKLGPIIGLGTYGEVRYAENSQGLPVAIKIVDLSKFEDDAAEMMTKEIKILQALDHPQVIRVLEVLDNVPYKGTWCESCACSELKSTFNGTCANCQHDTCDHSETMESRDVLMIVQELAAGGELFGLLTQGAFPESLARFYFRQLIAGLEHCHSRGIVHRDLKPENLVLDANFNLKIVDFGLAAINGKGCEPTHHSGVGSQPYTAPEVYYNKELYHNRGYYGEPADIWSCAVILYVMLKGSPPFRRPLLKSIGSSPRLRRCPHFSALMRGKGYNKISPAAKEFLQKLFIIEPRKRLSIKEIKEEAWFKGPVPSPAQVCNMVKYKAREVWMEQLKPEMAEVLEKYSGSLDDEKEDEEKRVIDHSRPPASAPMQIPRRPRRLSPSNSYISTPTKSMLHSFRSTSPAESPPFMPSASPAFTPLGTPSGTPSTPSHMPSPSPIFSQLPAIFNLASSQAAVSNQNGPLIGSAQKVVLPSKPPQISALGRSLLHRGPLAQNSSTAPGHDEKTTQPNDPFQRMNTNLSMLQLHSDEDIVKRSLPTTSQCSEPHECKTETYTRTKSSQGDLESCCPQKALSCSNEDRMDVCCESQLHSEDSATSKFAVRTQLKTNGSMREIIYILLAYFSTSESMQNMGCVVDNGVEGISTLHVTGTYSHYKLNCKIDISSAEQDRRTIAFRRIQGNTLAFQRFFMETSRAIWNR